MFALNRILRVLTVRPVTSGWPSLTLRLQAGLGANTRITDSGIRHDVVNTYPIVPGVRRGVSDTGVIVSDINRSKSRNYEKKNSQNSVVSSSCPLSVTEQPLTVA